MDIEYLKKLRKTESEKIHDELFETTTEHKYYEFGVAQGLYFIYNLLNEYKNNPPLTNVEWMGVIERCANNNGKLTDHFNRMIKKIKENNESTNIFESK